MSAKSNLLMKKEIQTFETKKKCNHCDGLGVISLGAISASRIKNLKSQNILNIENDCEECFGEGTVFTSVRKILKREKEQPIII